MPDQSSNINNAKRIAYFVSPHGFGHAARAAAVMQAISEIDASVEFENFTWDWIYEQYAAADSRFRRHINYLQSLFEAADYHIKTEPACCRSPADLTTPPVSRKIRTPADRIRKGLAIPATARMVLITTGGINQCYGFVQALKEISDVRFVLPGAGSKMETRQNCVILPRRSDFYHPDLVNACDAVVGKVGYSTLAEVYQAGVPFGYVTRSNFRESEPMADFIESSMPGLCLNEPDFNSGRWLARLQDLFDLNRLQQRITNGSDQIGRFIRDRILKVHGS